MERKRLSAALHAELHVTNLIAADVELEKKDYPEP
jgi:hypothetical protein